MARLHARVLLQPANRLCADCGACNPGWASVGLGIFICDVCAGMHRKLGTHISQVRSVKLDEWKTEWLSVMERVGNARAQAYYEHGLAPAERYVGGAVMARGDRIRAEDAAALEAWIRAKYEERRFAPPGVVAPHLQVAVALVQPQEVAPQQLRVAIVQPWEEPALGVGSTLAGSCDPPGGWPKPQAWQPSAGSASAATASASWPPNGAPASAKGSSATGWPGARTGAWPPDARPDGRTAQVASPTATLTPSALPASGGVWAVWPPAEESSPSRRRPEVVAGSGASSCFPCAYVCGGGMQAGLRRLQGGAVGRYDPLRECEADESPQGASGARRGLMWPRRDA